MKNPAIYILASKRYGTLYIGVTSDLIKIIYQHKNNEIEGVTKKYNVKKLVYFEQSEDMLVAIECEKQIKRWNRSWKIHLIEKCNPNWNDLYLELL